MQTYSLGLKLGNLYLDWGRIKTFYKFYNDDINITIYSASYIWKKFLLNVATRNEDTPLLKYQDEKLINQREQVSTYGGIQYSLNSYAILGVHYNYFLLDEVSASLALFF